MKYLFVIFIVISILYAEDINNDHGVPEGLAAIENNEINNVKIFINKNNVNNDNYGYTPLQLSCKLKRYEIFLYLLKIGGNVNFKSQDSLDTLAIAASTNDINIIKILIQNGININSQFNISFQYNENKVNDRITLYRVNEERYQSFLMVAIKHDNEELVKYLLQNNININLQDENGETSLMKAIKYKKLSLIKILKRYNPDLKIRNVNGESVKDYFQKYGIKY